MTKRTRILSALLAAAVALVLLSSALYLITRADHDCCGGPDCAVCQQLSACVQALRSLALAAGTVSAVLALGRAASQTAPVSVRPARRKSLVSLKVKLTD